jgi:hypothetical protein
MSDRIIQTMMITCAMLVTSYVCFMVATIYFAAWQTQAVSSVRNTESAIGNLEANYYQTVNRLSALDPSSLGYVTPVDVEYVAEAAETSTGLSFAGN